MAKKNRKKKSNPTPENSTVANNNNNTEGGNQEDEEFDATSNNNNNSNEQQLVDIISANDEGINESMEEQSVSSFNDETNNNNTTSTIINTEDFIEYNNNSNSNTTTTITTNIDNHIDNTFNSTIDNNGGVKWKNPYDDEIVPGPSTTFEQSEFFSSDDHHQTEKSNSYFAEDDELNHRVEKRDSSFLTVQQTSLTTHRKYINPYDSDSEMETSNRIIAHHSEEIEEPIVDTLSIPRNESVMNNSILSSTPNAEQVPSNDDLHIETARQPLNTLENRSFGLKIFDLFIAFFPFGFISFGGPVANVGLLGKFCY